MRGRPRSHCTMGAGGLRVGAVPFGGLTPPQGGGKQDDRGRLAWDGSPELLSWPPWRDCCWGRDDSAGLSCGEQSGER